jgi:acetyl esterase/lipase
MRTVLLSLLWAGTALAQAPHEFTIEKDIPYGRYPDTRLDVVQPAGPAAGLRPAVLFLHGGGWITSTKELRLEPHCLRYVRRGFVCVNVEYRLAKVALAPAAVEDVLQAAAWLRKNARKYHVDPQRVVVSGDSAGGHLSLMVGLTPRSARLGPPAKVRAVVNLYGITDVGDQLQGKNMRSYATAWIPEQPGRMELARRVSPMTYVRGKVPAILTVHGDADPVVPYEHGVAITKALRAKGAAAELVTVPGGKHGFAKDKADEIYEKEIFPFLRKHGVLK